MKKGPIAMLLDRLFPSRCRGVGDELRRASELHAISTLAVGREARKITRRVEDFRVTANAAELRAKERGVIFAVEDALQSHSFGGTGDSDA